MSFYQRFEHVVALVPGAVYWLLRERDDRLAGAQRNGARSGNAD